MPILRKVDMLVYPVPDSAQRIIFPPEVLTHFQKHRQLGGHSVEAGGQLFARFEGEQIHVVEATGPCRTDRRSRFSFLPSRKREQTDIASRYRKGLHFIGDWHTHPEDVPRPSSTDIESINDCFRKSKHELSAFVLVIVGRHAPPDGLHVSLHNGDSNWRLSCAPATRGARA